MIIGDKNAERALGEQTRKEFNEAARGDKADDAQKGDKAQQDHNIEPSLNEKREGAAMDRSGSQKLFEQMKASRSQDKDRGMSLG